MKWLALIWIIRLRRCGKRWNGRRWNGGTIKLPSSEGVFRLQVGGGLLCEVRRKSPAKTLVVAPSDVNRKSFHRLTVNRRTFTRLSFHRHPHCHIKTTPIGRNNTWPRIGGCTTREVTGIQQIIDSSLYF